MLNLQKVIKFMYGSVSNVPQAREDVVQLYNAFRGNACDLPSVIKILAHRNASQRALIEQEYHKKYSEDFKRQLSLKLNGDILKAILLWMPDPVTRDAIILQEAFFNKNLQVATQVLCSKTPSQIQSVKNIYHTRYGIYLEQETILKTSDHLEDLLLAYLSIHRSDGKEFDQNIAVSDAKALHANRSARDKKSLISTFTGRSRAQLVAASSEYRRLYGKTLKEAIQKHTSGLFQQALVTILECAENTAGYFAKILNNTKHTRGTNDTTLIHIIVSRTEIDMKFIKEEYKKLCKRTLSSAVQSITSGHYRTFLLALVGTI